jgi:ELWxxDGT repeat protein
MQQRTTNIIFFFFLLLGYGAAGQPVLVKDIRAGSSGGIWLGSGKSAVAGNTFYFTADNGVVGTELWKSDGTEAGTVLVRDISQVSQIEGVGKFLLSYKGQLYFEGQDTMYGSELWQTTDGPEGAALVRDACPGNCSPNLPSTGLGEFQGKLFFQSYASGSEEELWVTDGTVAGTQLFKDIDPGGGSRPYGFQAYKNRLYFIADSFSKGFEPYYTDGTPSGTRRLKDILPGFQSSSVSGFKPTSNVLYFFADDGVNGYELWKTNGTSAGTVMVKNIASGSNDGIYIYAEVANTMELNGNLLFIANDGTTGRELWTTDGTEAGTVLVKDIRPGSSNSDIIFMANLNGKVLFRANDGTNGSELWITDGTAAGTKMLKNINAGSADGFGFVAEYVVYQKYLYFTATNGSKGRELWVSDGTEAGTVLAYDINLGSAESNPSDYQVLGTNLLFFAEGANKGRELWKLDLTSVGTHEPLYADLIHIFPTLSGDGLFQFSLTEMAGDALSLRVFDAQGRECANRQVTSGSNDLNLSQLASGVYFVHAVADGKYQSVQRIIIH